MGSLFGRKRVSIGVDTHSIVRVFQQSRLYGGQYIEPPPHTRVWPRGWLTKRREYIDQLTTPVGSGTDRTA